MTTDCVLPPRVASVRSPLQRERRIEGTSWAWDDDDGDDGGDTQDEICLPKSSSPRQLFYAQQCPEVKRGLVDRACSPIITSPFSTSRLIRDEEPSETMGVMRQPSLPLPSTRRGSELWTRLRHASACQATLRRLSRGLLASRKEPVMAPFFWSMSSDTSRDPFEANIMPRRQSVVEKLALATQRSIPIALPEGASINEDVDTHSRGMPPIFGFLGKVSAQGKKAMINSIVLLLANVIFVSCSALMFSELENNKENRMKMVEEKLSQIGDLQFFLGLKYNHNHTIENEKFPNHKPGHIGWDDEDFKELVALHKERCFKINNFHAMNNLWNFWSAFDFCATVLTTIGYGSMYPRTDAGKWFCIVYSIIGIPIMAMYLALFAKGICYILSFCVTGLSNLASTSWTNYKLSGFQARLISLGILFVALIAFILMWSLILNKTNAADSFLTCVYFYVITLTTVGIGDISMTEARPLVLIRVLFLFCVGLNLMTCVFNALRSVSAAHTKMIQEAGSKLKTKAQGVVLDGAQKLMRGSQSQLDPLTKDIDSNDSDQVETIFSHFNGNLESTTDPPEYSSLSRTTNGVP